ncbi:MAG: hypothetical protein FJ078_01570 [Cyanobacteria bacterium K_DeepCast_35m_m2_155]|nr:hypothetical protein [Cyanobacteria bacterium K_DeepCast_35m_m2_155]
MEDLLQNALETAAEEALGAGLPSANPLVFIAITAVGLLMALVYVPVRVFLTITARSRRLKLLQRIRKLRDELSPS